MVCFVLTLHDSDPLLSAEMAADDVHPDYLAFCERFKLSTASNMIPQFHEVFDNYNDIEQIRGSVSLSLF